MHADQNDLLGGVSGADFDALASVSETEEVPQYKWAQNLADMVAVQEAAFIKQERMDPAEAFRLARVGVIAMAQHHGGRQFYLPRGEALLKAMRDLEIFRRFNGANIDALAAEYGLTDSQIYRINRQQKALHRKKYQKQLF